MDRPINILYGNCQKKKAATLQLNHRSDLSKDIIVITEPFMGKNRKATFQSPWNVHSDSKDARAIIITPPWADAFELPEHSDRDSYFCIINSKVHTFILGVYYCDEGNINDNTWVPRLNALRQICPEVIIFSDTNAHSTLWGYTRSDVKGRKWEDVLAQTNCEVFTNTYFTSFRNSRNQSSCIDIVFGTPSSKFLISDRIVDPNTLSSDHIPWSIQFKDDPIQDDREHLKLRETDWDKVNHVLNEKLKSITIAEIPDKDHIDYIVEKFNLLLNQTIEETINKSRTKPLNRWWTPELSRLQAAVDSEPNPNTKLELGKELDKKNT